MINWFLENMLFFQIIGFIITVVFVMLTARLMAKMDYFSSGTQYSFRKLRKNPSTRDLMNPYWNKVLRWMGTDKPENWKYAVRDADKIFDESLKSIGTKGKTIEERIQAVDPEVVGSLDELSRLRDKILPILKEEDGELTKDDAKEILRAYRSALEKMGMV